MDPRLVTLCLGGGLFAIMVFIHAFTDFVCQTHYEAMNKHNNAKIRARHCLIYTIGFLPLLALLTFFGALTGWELFFAINILFWSHFVEDTYYPVVLWAKFVRKPPCMNWSPREHLLPVEDQKYFLINMIRDTFGTSIKSTTIAPTDPARTNVLVNLNAGELTVKEAQAELDRIGFLEFINEFLGKYLMIAIDQIIHFSFLFPIVWMALNR